MVSAIDKLRNVLNWANYQNEGFNERFKSISDIEIAYDYCQANNLLEFLDWESLQYLSDREYNTVKGELFKLLGYSVF